MKNSKQYSKKVEALYRKLKRRYPKVKKIVYDNPVDAVVNGIISEKMTESAAQAVIERFNEHFVDTNDLRVSLTQEIVELLGGDSAANHQIALALITVLRSIFEKYNTVTLSELEKIGKRPARQALEKINGLSHFAVCYCLLTALDAHSIPLTETMIKYLRDNELINAQADEHDIEGFLTRLIPAKNGYEFYALLRKESESVKPKAVKRKPRKKKKVAVTAKKSKKRAKKTKGKA